jgi:hypothetical protein
VITGLDHVQLAIPSGAEDIARAFYGGVLEMTEMPKPAALAVRGGCWFTAGSAVLHLGVEEPFAPARKAHPAFLVCDLDPLAATLATVGYDCTWAPDIPGVRRFHCFDPFGNRIEFQLRQNEITLSGALVLRYPSVLIRHEPSSVIEQPRRAFRFNSAAESGL